MPILYNTLTRIVLTFFVTLKLFSYRVVCRYAPNKGIADFGSTLVPFGQEGLKGRSERLKNSSCIQPIEEDLSVQTQLLEDSKKKMTDARAERDKLLSATQAATRKRDATEAEVLMRQVEEAEEKLEKEIAKYDDRVEKLMKARRGAETKLAAEHKELEIVLSAFRTAVPKEARYR